MSDELAEKVRAELDPTPASGATWPVSRRQVLRGLAASGALALGPGAASGAAGTGIADQAFFSNYGWESTADGGELTIDGSTFTFDGSDEIGLPDGGTGTEVVTPSGETASEVIGPGGSVIFERVNEPSTVASRPDDNDSISRSDQSQGIVVTPKEDFTSIGARISSNTSGVSRARLYDHANDEYIATVDVSSLSSDGAFSIEADLISGQDYGIELDNGTGDWTAGYNSNSDSYPYSSSDVDITGQSSDGSVNETSFAIAVNDVGNPDGVLD